MVMEASLLVALSLALTSTICNRHVSGNVEAQRLLMITYTVRVDREGDLNLRHAFRCRWNRKLEVAEHLVVADEFTFTLEDLDFDSGLAIGGGREDLRFLGRDGSVAV